MVCFFGLYKFFFGLSTCFYFLKELSQAKPKIDKVTSHLKILNEMVVRACYDWWCVLSGLMLCFFFARQASPVALSPQRSVFGESDSSDHRKTATVLVVVLVPMSTWQMGSCSSWLKNPKHWVSSNESPKHTKTFQVIVYNKANSHFISFPLWRRFGRRARDWGSPTARALVCTWGGPVRWCFLDVTHGYTVRRCAFIGFVLF